MTYDAKIVDQARQLLKKAAPQADQEHGLTSIRSTPVQPAGAAPNAATDAALIKGSPKHSDDMPRSVAAPECVVVPLQDCIRIRDCLKDMAEITASPAHENLSLRMIEKLNVLLAAVTSAVPALDMDAIERARAAKEADERNAAMPAQHAELVAPTLLRLKDAVDGRCVLDRFQLATIAELIGKLALSAQVPAARTADKKCEAVRAVAGGTGDTSEFRWCSPCGKLLKDDEQCERP